MESKRNMEEQDSAETADENNAEIEAHSDEQPMPSLEEQESVLKKKYGGVIPKKPPLISKDHERAYFDSADWALGKEGKMPGQNPEPMIEALRPKLEPTPHQPLPSRRASYAPTDGEDIDAPTTPLEEAI